jgi:hypothetical protein
LETVSTLRERINKELNIPIDKQLTIWLIKRCEGEKESPRDYFCTKPLYSIEKFNPPSGSFLFEFFLLQTNILFVEENTNTKNEIETPSSVIFDPINYIPAKPISIDLNINWKNILAEINMYICRFCGGCSIIPDFERHENCPGKFAQFFKVKKNLVKHVNDSIFEILKGTVQDEENNYLLIFPSLISCGKCQKLFKISQILSHVIQCESVNNVSKCDHKNTLLFDVMTLADVGEDNSKPLFLKPNLYSFSLCGKCLCIILSKPYIPNGSSNFLSIIKNQSNIPNTTVNPQVDILFRISFKSRFSESCFKYSLCKTLGDVQENIMIDFLSPTSKKKWGKEYTHFKPKSTSCVTTPTLTSTLTTSIQSKTHNSSTKSSINSCKENFLDICVESLELPLLKLTIQSLAMLSKLKKKYINYEFRKKIQGENNVINKEEKRLHIYEFINIFFFFF